MDHVVSYKALKEDFVSNLTGGTIEEINYVTAVAPVSPGLQPLFGCRSYGYTGCFDCVVSPTVSNILLFHIWPIAICRGLPAQCWMHPSSYNVILLNAGLLIGLVAGTNHLQLPCAASCTTKGSSQTPFEVRRRETG